MRCKNLFNLLLQQVENLKELLFAIKLQQECLVNNNSDKLEETIKAASVLFTRINELQASIISEIKIIDKDENLGLKQFRLSELIQHLSNEDETAKKLVLVRRHILSYMQEISKLNFQNSYLIDHSRQMIKSILTTAAQSKNAIFDRRV